MWRATLRIPKKIFRSSSARICVRSQHAKDADERGQGPPSSDLLVNALGDGSDYTAFQDYAGIPTLDIGFGGEDDGDQYHSIYDDFYWYTHFADTDFSYGRALAQTAGTAMMRLADADLLPYDYSPQAEAIAKYETELEKLLKDKQDEFTERNLELQEGVFSATADPHKTYVPPPAETVPPYMNFAPMKNSIELLKKSAERYSQSAGKIQSESPAQFLRKRSITVNADLLGSLAPVSEREGTARAAVVQEPDLRSGSLHRIRRQAHRRRPRIHGRKEVERSRRPNSRWSPT